jgi:GNAT superfamily N-acetyltransferase
MPDTAAAYRALRADEEDAVLRLWTEVFEIERAYFERYFRGDDRRRLEHTQVAVAPDGRLLAAVHTCLRELRDADGTPRRVGCLANVATRLDARRRGHSGQLLRRAIEGMQAEGCDWSLLFTGTNHHYERYGWRTVPTTHLRGTMVAGPAPGGSAAAYTIRRLELSGAGTDTWQTLAAVHAAFNARRPLTALRGLAYWRGFASRWFTQPGAVVLTAHAPTPDRARRSTPTSSPTSLPPPPTAPAAARYVSRRSARSRATRPPWKR